MNNSKRRVTAEFRTRNKKTKRENSQTNGKPASNIAESTESEPETLINRIVATCLSPIKLDKFIRTQQPFADLFPSTNHIEFAIKSRKILVNESLITKPFYVLSVGDKISITQEAAKEVASHLFPNPLAKFAQILNVTVHYDSANLAIIWKPCGVPTTGDSTTTKSLASLIPHLLKTTSIVSFHPQLEISASGLVICCKNTIAADQLRILYTGGLISETWTVLCSGNVSTIRAGLEKDGTFEIDDDLDGSVQIDPPKKFKSLLKRELEAWTSKRSSDLADLSTYGIEITPKIELELDIGVPVAYIAGKKSFCGIEFIVTPSVMIPKIGTEVLVHSILSLKPKSPQRVLDLGTGSGCLLLSILKSLPQDSIGIGIDISEEALTISNQNKNLLRLHPRQHAIFGKSSFGNVASFLDSLDLAALEFEKRAFDTIVTNPPYLPSPLWDSGRLYAQQRHEPKISVVSGIDGMEAYKEIKAGLDVAAKSGWIRPGTCFFVEVNSNQLGESVRKIFLEDASALSSEGWNFSKIYFDANGMERCIVFEWNLIL
ncbi:hypothetical protein HK100_003727 [Physocladia obscura]|uniref:peptide chain release factor N(5)-glutamine methyltransferase n=1 Tax=Physocladia obscura TaxID=109957 RepID=A0AAD5SU07_9FUNG|nr:hypothetical protein HK100_003727 [Physocladia obscura]